MSMARAGIRRCKGPQLPWQLTFKVRDLPKGPMAGSRALGSTTSKLVAATVAVAISCMIDGETS